MDATKRQVTTLVTSFGTVQADASAALWHADLDLAESIISGQSEITTVLPGH
jgi:hypothetical protein